MPNSTHSFLDVLGLSDGEVVVVVVAVAWVPGLGVVGSVVVVAFEAVEMVLQAEVN